MAKYLTLAGLQAFLEKLKGYVATTSRNGLMSAVDKTRFSAITNIIPSSFDFTNFDVRNLYGKCFNTDEISVTSIQGAKIYDIRNGWALHVIKIVESENQIYQVRVGSYNGPAITACSTNKVGADDYEAMFLIVLPTAANMVSKYYITY